MKTLKYNKHMCYNGNITIKRKEQEMILYAITLKNMARDANGLPNYIWATDSQIKTIQTMRNNPDKRYNFVKIGGFIFSPMDISHIEEKNTDYYGGPIPKYVRERYEADLKLEQPKVTRQLAI